VLRLLALRLSARVIPMTGAVAELFRGGAGLPEHVEAIPDGIDLAEFHPRVSGARIRRELGIAGEVPLVGFVARLDPWKGADVFVRAAALVARERPEARFLVCAGPVPGYEGYAREVKGLAAALGLGERMVFTDWRYRLDDIPEVMAALDVFVHTSVRPEPFGLVLVEAMATMKPVVAANAGGVPEVVEDGVTGLLVPPGDAAAVAAAVLGVLAEPGRARAMGAAGRARAEARFEVGAYAARIQAVYASILGASCVRTDG
jgi:glycosyltransferase involved in cell wall biosynthesis